MGLSGYQAQQVQAPQLVSASTPGTAIAQQQFGSLADKLESFSRSKFKDIEMQTVAQAEKDAYNDSINGEEFYSESVTTAYGRAYNNVSSATFASNADLMINQRNDELLLEFENNPTAYDENMKEYVAGLSKDAPTPELQSVISISGTKLKNNTFGKLSILENNRIKAGQVETFKQEWDLNVSQIIELRATGNTIDSDLLIGKNKEHLKAMVDSGLITPADAQARIKETQFDTTNGVAQRDMESLLMEADLENATKYLNAELSQERGDMDVDENAKHQASLAKLYNAEVRSREANRKKASDFSNETLKAITEIRKDGGAVGYTPEEEKAARAGATSKASIVAYDNQKKIDDEVADWKTMSITEQEDRLTLWEGKERKGKDQELINQLRDSLKERKERAKKDSVGLAIKEGIIEAPAYKMSATDGIDSLIAGIDDMKDKVYNIQETLGEEYTNLLQKEDANSWARYFEAPGNSTDKLVAIEKLTQYHPEVAKQIFSQISKENAPSMTFAATLSLDGNKEAARLSLKGKSSGVEIKDGGTLKSDISSKVRGVFKGFSPQTADQMVNGVVNYNKGLVSEGEEALDADSAVRESLGEVKNYNGQDVLLPRGVDSDDFEDWISNMEFPDNVALQTRIRSSVDFFGDRNVQLRYAGQGQYYVHMIRGGKGFNVLDEYDDLLILDYNKGKK